MMEGSEKNIDPESVPVYLPRTSEVRNVLYGLATFNFYKSWTFPDAEYYQYVLITWLEKNKATNKEANLWACYHTARTTACHMVFGVGISRAMPFGRKAGREGSL